MAANIHAVMLSEGIIPVTLGVHGVAVTLGGSVSVTVTTTKPNTLLVVLGCGVKLSSTSMVVTVSDNQTLTWTRRINGTQDTNGANTWMHGEGFSAVAAVAQTYIITASITGTPTASAIGVIAIESASTATRWDANANFPFGTFGSSLGNFGASSPTALTTNTVRDFAFTMVVGKQNANTAFTFTNWTALDTAFDSGGNHITISTFYNINTGLATPAGTITPSTTETWQYWLDCVIPSNP